MCRAVTQSMVSAAHRSRPNQCESRRSGEAPTSVCAALARWDDVREQGTKEQGTRSPPQDYIRAASTGDDAHSGQGVAHRRKGSGRIQNQGLGHGTWTTACVDGSVRHKGKEEARRPSSPEPVAIPEQKQHLQPTSVEVSTQERERRLARLGQGRGSARVAIVQRAAVTTRQSEQVCVTPYYADKLLSTFPYTYRN